MKKFNAEKLKEKLIVELKKDIKALERINIQPKLVIVQVEGDKASDSYVKNKVKLGSELNIDVEHMKLERTISQKVLNGAIQSLNNNDEVDGVILQLPLPLHLDFEEALMYLDKHKDVDGLTLTQQGMLQSNMRHMLIPCTASGVLQILRDVYEEDGLSGKDVVIVNRSHLIGKPLSQLLLNQNCTVTICHSRTKNLKEKIRNADIVVTGIGKAKYFDNSYFRDGQTIVDCSMNFFDGKLCGDVDIDTLEDLDVTISSGKGQTGPLTVLSLMINTVRTCCTKHAKKIINKNKFIM